MDIFRQIRYWIDRATSTPRRVFSRGGSPFECKRGMETLLKAAMDNSDDEGLNDPKNDWSSAKDQLMKGAYWQNFSQQGQHDAHGELTS